MGVPRKHASTYLIEIEHEIQLAHIPEELVKYLDEEMDRLQVGQFIVIGVHADAKKQSRISPVDNLGTPSKLYKI